MTQTTVPPVRVRARVLAFVVAGMAALSLAYACTESKRAPGDQCLKSDDCLSGICSQLVCGSQGPLTDTMTTNTDASTSDAPAGEGSSDTGSAADTFTATETGGEAASEAGEAAAEASSD